MNADATTWQLLVAAFAGGATAGAAFVLRYVRPATNKGEAKTNALGAVYIKCKDCGLEHAVYPTGECHAVRDVGDPRQEPNVPPLAERAATLMGEAGGRAQSQARPIPRCVHGIPVSRPCERCSAQIRPQGSDGDVGNPRRG